MKKIFLLILGFVTLSCSTSTNHREQAIEEIFQAEADFNQMAGDSGVSKAFTHFAARDAVMLRGDKLIRGKDSIIQHLLQSRIDDIELTWSPDFVDASQSGDLGYSYGKYTVSFSDSTGTKTNHGVFHTVWKRQPDGTWRFVWD